jgi:hypothetical protein
LWIQPCTGQELPKYSLTDAPIVVSIDSIRRIHPKLSNFVNVRYIPLETNDDCLIGSVKKVLVRNSRIYVADFSRAIALFVFDMNGKFLFKIARMGQGPGEYTSFRDFDIQANGDIYMFDHFGRKFLVFNSDGKYLREIGMDYHFSSFCLVKDKIYWSKLSENGKKRVDLAVYDMTDKKTEFLLKGKSEDRHHFVSYDFYSSPPDIIYYSPRLSEIIYAIDDKGIRPFIGIKDLRMPPEHVVKEWDEILSLSITKDDLYFKENTHIYETERHIAFRCIEKRNSNSKYLIYDKQSGSFSSISTFYFDMLLCVDGIMGSTGKDFFSGMIPQPEYKEHRQLLESREELKNWNEDDNPVIVIFNLDI